ncbi:MAG: hypothetical protein QOJ40_2401, partial [Verrucomicrobiota bacterium]
MESPSSCSVIIEPWYNLHPDDVPKDAPATWGLHLVGTHGKTL